MPATQDLTPSKLSNVNHLYGAARVTDPDLRFGITLEDHKIQFTEVDGTEVTGLHAADGSINVVIDDVDGHTGVYHPCGALLVNSDDGETYYDALGNVYTNRVFGPGLES